MIPRFQLAALIVILMFLTSISSLIYFIINANFRMFLLHISFFGLFLFLIFYATDKDAPYVPTSKNVVKTMLKLANVGSNDVVYDLGCGDGRILFSAIEEFDALKAVGCDLNSKMCDVIQKMIDEKGFKNRIEVQNKDFMLIDISSATVVTLYLSKLGNFKLRPKMEEELKPGTRVLSNDFPVEGWITTKPYAPEYYSVGSHKIYYYIVPAAYEKSKNVLNS